VQILNKPQIVLLQKERSPFHPSKVV